MRELKLLEGDIADEDDRDQQIADLLDEIRALKSELSTANRATLQAQREASRGVAELRRVLTPLYRGLQQVFGQLDTLGADDSATPASPAGDPRIAAIWASWKSRMGAAAPIIDALLVHGEMNTSQLAIAIQRSRKTVPALIFKLNRAGLLNKNGNRFSLKQL